MMRGCETAGDHRKRAADFDTFMCAEAAKWGPIPKQANIRVE